MLLCQKSKAAIITARNKYLGSDKKNVKQQYRGRMFLSSDKKQILQGTKQSQRINCSTDIVYLKWALQPISSTYDDIYQEKWNTILQTSSFSQIIHLLKHSLLTHEIIVMEIK